MSDWGVSITDPNTLAQTLFDENATTILAAILPPVPVNQTIQGFASDLSSLGINPIAANQSTDRYGQTFSGQWYLDLVLADNSYVMQGQWFIAASYGLMQQKPESVRTAVARAPLDPAERDRLNDIYDPRVDNPAALFDPSVSLEFAALMQENAQLTPETQRPIQFSDNTFEETCQTIAPLPNQCTWNRYWKRALRVYNGGYEDRRNGYDEKVFRILNDIDQFLPIAGNP